MIILHEFVDFIEVIRIKMFAVGFSKELHFVSICLGDFAIVA